MSIHYQMDYHTQEFLNFLGTRSDAYHIFVRIQKDIRQKIFARPAMDEVSNEKFVGSVDEKSQVYVSVNLCKKMFNKPNLKDVRYWGIEYIDIDVERPDHTIPATNAELHRVKPDVATVKRWLKDHGFLPGYTDFTGNGWRILLPVPLLSLKRLSHDDVLNINAQKKEWLRIVEKDTGVDLDVGVNELSRISGVPGTMNVKVHDSRDRRRQAFRGCERVEDDKLQDYVMGIEIPEETINRKGFIRNVRIDEFVELLTEIDKSLESMLTQAPTVKTGHRSDYDFAIACKLLEYDLNEEDMVYVLQKYGTTRVKKESYVRNTVRNAMLR